MFAEDQIEKVGVHPRSPPEYYLQHLIRNLNIIEDQIYCFKKLSPKIILIDNLGSLTSEPTIYQGSNIQIYLELYQNIIHQLETIQSC